MFYKAYRTAATLGVAVLMFWSFSAPRAQALSRAAESWGPASAPAATSVVVYSQPPKATGGFIQSSLRDPDGSATDRWAWDGFKISWLQDITEIQWQGGYNPAIPGAGGPVSGFTVDIYASIPTGGEPDVAHPPLVHYEVIGNAGETPAEVLGGVQTYDYRFTLPTPFSAAAGAKYWVQIEAFQTNVPNWGLSLGTGGDGQYFRRVAGEGYNYQVISGDAAFTLLGPQVVRPIIYLPLLFKF